MIFDDDDLDAGPREDDATKLATVRLGRAAAIGLGSAVIRILSMPSSFIVCQQVLVVASCKIARQEMQDLLRINCKEMVSISLCNGM